MRNWTELNYSSQSNVFNCTQKLGIWRVPWRMGWAKWTWSYWCDFYLWVGTWPRGHPRFSQAHICECMLMRCRWCKILSSEMVALSPMVWLTHLQLLSSANSEACAIKNNYVSSLRNCTKLMKKRSSKGGKLISGQSLLTKGKWCAGPVETMLLLSSSWVAAAWGLSQLPGTVINTVALSPGADRPHGDNRSLSTSSG